MNEGASGGRSLAVEVGRARPDRPEFDAIFLQPFLNFHSKELAAPVSLNALNRKGHFFDNTLKKSDGVRRGPARIQPHDLVAGAIIHRSIMIAPRRDLADVHLHSITGNGATVALGEFPPSDLAGQELLVISVQNLLH